MSGIWIGSRIAAARPMSPSPLRRGTAPRAATNSRSALWLAPIDDGCADRLPLAEHRHGDHAPPTRCEGEAPMVFAVSEDILDLDHRPAQNGPPRHRVALGWSRMQAPQGRQHLGCEVVVRDE